MIQSKWISLGIIYDQTLKLLTENINMYQLKNKYTHYAILFVTQFHYCGFWL